MFSIYDASHGEYRYFRNVLPDMAVASCACCKRFFQQEEWDLSQLQGEGCPFCKHSAQVWSSLRVLFLAIDDMCVCRVTAAAR